jgi:hypothetical protein
MRKSRLLTCVMVAVLVVFAASFVVIAADTTAPETITIKSKLWATPTKAPVEFTHKKHAEDYKIACTDCHHVFKDGQNVWKQGDPVQKCEECHNEPTIQGEKKLPEAQQKLNLKLAYHDNCVGCHQKLKKDKPDTKAPVTCIGCHPAQK